MLEFLQGLHRAWLEEVRNVLDPALQAEAGAWMRWRAVQYLETGFARRFGRERQAVASLHAHLTPAQATHLWAGGELLTQMLARVNQSVGLCHHVDEFAAMAHNLLAAVEYWCQQVEEALGPVRWGGVLPEARHLFEVISYDELAEGC
jgi:hypothetical protein